MPLYYFCIGQCVSKECMNSGMIWMPLRRLNGHFILFILQNFGQIISFQKLTNKYSLIKN